MKPTAVSLSYMGFCASSGAAYMDGLITDRIASPPDYQAYIVLWVHEALSMPMCQAMPSRPYPRNGHAAMPR